MRALEESRDTAELPEASGEAIAREFERYLKRRAPTTTGRSDLAPMALRAAGRGGRPPGSGATCSLESSPWRASRGRPGVQRRMARGASRSSASAPRTASGHRPRGGTGAAGDRAAEPLQVAAGRGRRSRRSTPSRCGSGAAAGRAGGRTGRRRGPQLGDEHQVAHRLRHLLAVERHHAGVHVGVGEGRRRVDDVRLGRRSSRGAGTPGRCRRPGRRSPPPGARRAIAAHSTCHPGRPGPSGDSHAGSPGRSAATAGSRAGPSCRRGRGRRRARRKIASMRSRRPAR